MLSSATVFTSFSTNKLLDSYYFYRDVLALEVELVDDRFIHAYLHGLNPLIIYYKEEHVAASFTVLNFQVTNIEHIVDKLIEEGVVFLQYDEPIKTDEKGISWDDNGSHLAWFKDPGDNILALIEN